MTNSSKNTFKIHGSIKTFVAFSKKYSFKIGTKIILNIPTEKGKNEFELIGKVETDNFQVAEIEGLEILDDFCNKLSFFFNVPIKSINIINTRLEKNNGTNVSASKVTIEAKAAIAVNDSNIDNFREVINNENGKNIISMFKRCKSENNDISFWTVYNIMQILIGERKEIDEYLKANFPDLQILHSNYGNQDNTILIAIRDSFSHKKTYSGKPLDIQLELKSNINIFQNIARKTIMNKLKIII
jgi:hypothetical protein